MDALTVEYSKNPGHKFRRKVLECVNFITITLGRVNRRSSKIKRGMQTTLVDTTYNRLQSSLKNIFQSLCDAALVCLYYMKGIARLHKPGVSVLLSTYLSPSLPNPDAAYDPLANAILSVETVSDAGNLAFALTQSKRNKHRFPDYECNVTLRSIRWSV